MDGVSHYVTVRRDIFTGLVAASTTTVPVTTLASTSIITDNKSKVGHTHKEFVKWLWVSVISVYWFSRKKEKKETFSPPLCLSELSLHIVLQPDLVSLTFTQRVVDKLFDHSFVQGIMLAFFTCCNFFCSCYLMDRWSIDKWDSRALQKQAPPLLLSVYGFNNIRFLIIIYSPTHLPESS